MTRTRRSVVMDGVDKARMTRTRRSVVMGGVDSRIPMFKSW